MDYKSLLQEMVQTDKKSVEYKLINESGPAHNRVFEVCVVIDDIVYGKGVGKSKKEAEQKAARKKAKEQGKTEKQILKENELNVDAKRPRTHRSIIVIAVFFMVLLAPTLFMNYSNEIIVNDDAIEIKGEYSMNINMNDIDTVMLVNNLPPIKIRTNGISTGKVNIGNFKMSDDNTCRLYVNKDVDMFIEIKLNAQCSQPEASMIFKQ